MDRIKSLQPMLIAHLAFKRNMETALKKYGLHPGNPKFMLYIADHEGCSQKDLAETFYIESCTLSSVLANMEERGFIERKNPKKINGLIVFTQPLRVGNYWNLSETSSKKQLKPPFPDFLQKKPQCFMIFWTGLPII